MKVFQSIPHHPRSFSTAYCVLFKMKTKVTSQYSLKKRYGVQNPWHVVDKANLQVYVLSHAHSTMVTSSKASCGHLTKYSAHHKSGKMGSRYPNVHCNVCGIYYLINLQDGCSLLQMAKMELGTFQSSRVCINSGGCSEDREEKVHVCGDQRQLHHPPRACKHTCLPLKDKAVSLILLTPKES